VESFFTDYLTLTRGCSTCTLESYRDTLKLLFAYVAQRRRLSLDRLRFVDFDANLILDFLEYLEEKRHNSVSTRNCRLAAVHSFFAHALRSHPQHAGRLARIVTLPPKRRPRPPPRHLDPPVVESLLGAADRHTPAGRRDYALILFLYNTGARASEAAGVRFQDLMAGPSVQLLGKGRKKRACPLWPETLGAIKAQMPTASPDPHSPVFHSRRGQALTRHGIYRILKRYSNVLHRKDVRFPAKVWPHLLRHSCAVGLLQEGADLVTIRDQLGHASIATTGRYATSNMKLKRAALERFWAATGMSSPKVRRWRPSPKLSEFLHSI
jgi:site-specific recombinase XerD